MLRFGETFVKRLDDWICICHVTPDSVERHDSAHYSYTSLTTHLFQREAQNPALIVNTPSPYSSDLELTEMGALSWFNPFAYGRVSTAVDSQVSQDPRLIRAAFVFSSSSLATIRCTDFPSTFDLDTYRSETRRNDRRTTTPSSPA